MAEVLSEHGITAYPTTVAKIESGERAVKVNELAVFADIFGVSLDALVGRPARPAGDLSYAEERLRAVLGHAERFAADESNMVHEAITELTAADPAHTRRRLVGDAAGVHTALENVIRLAQHIDREYRA
jgi:hypothetical protein